MISDSFALVPFYLFTTLLRSYRTEYGYAVFIQRLANGWAAIQSQTRFFTQLFFKSQSVHSFPPASCIHLAYTLHLPPR